MHDHPTIYNDSEALSDRGKMITQNIRTKDQTENLIYGTHQVVGVNVVKTLEGFGLELRGKL